MISINRNCEQLQNASKILPCCAHALGWLWALSPQIVPIPGFKTIKQVVENVETHEFGPLTKNQMRKIDRVLELFDYDFVVLD
ncbi:aldo/keto reductase [bacterium]|nr:aldo/keto reductase [bacterium]